MNWPPVIKKEVLHQFDEDVSTILEKAVKEDAERTLNCTTTVTVSLVFSSLAEATKVA